MTTFKNSTHGDKIRLLAECLQMN